MTKSLVGPRRAGVAVLLLSVGWVLAMAGLVREIFAVGMAGWADEQSNSGGQSAALHWQATNAALLLAVVAVGGPAVIAAVAFANRMELTGAAFAMVATAIGALVLTLGANGHRALIPPTPSPVPATVEPVACQEHSGGDNRCPGN